MDIIVNSQTKTVPDHVSLEMLAFEMLGEKQKGVAIAVNETVVAKNDWATTQLKPNDNIIIIKATQGG